MPVASADEPTYAKLQLFLANDLLYGYVLGADTLVS